MATTARGRALTEAHRIAQLENSARMFAAGQLLLGEMNPAQIDETLTHWAGLQSALTETFWAESKDLAAEYLAAYRVAEMGADGATMPIVSSVPFPARANALDALWLGPVAKRQISEGMSPMAALEWAFGHNVGVSQQRRVLNAGRTVIDQSTLANPASLGWRRVTDADPCEWCKVTASRGPVYRTAKSAGRGRRWHNRCGCSVEEVFGTWTPDDRERRWIDEYEAAHHPGDTIDDVAARMRSQAEQ